MFQKVDLFPSSGEGWWKAPTLLCFLKEQTSSTVQSPLVYQSQNSFTTDGQLASLSWYQAIVLVQVLLGLAIAVTVGSKFLRT